MPKIYLAETILLFVSTIIWATLLPVHAVFDTRLFRKNKTSKENYSNEETYDDQQQLDQVASLNDSNTLTQTDNIVRVSPPNDTTRHKVITIGIRFIFFIRIEPGDGPYLPDDYYHYARYNGGDDGFDSFGFGGGDA